MPAFGGKADPPIASYRSNASSPIALPRGAGDGCPGRGPIADRTRLAAPNKCLALNNKSRTRGKATKGRNPQ